MRKTSRLAQAATLAAIIVGAAACSSSSSPARSSGETPGAAAQAANNAAAQAAAKASIATAYITLFDLSNPALPPKVAVIQDGPALEPALKTALKSSIAKVAGGAKVLSATPLTSSKCTSEALPSPCEAVKFDILSTKGKTLLPDNGFAVYVGGKWLVAKVTICGLLALAGGGRVPAGC